MYSAGLADIFTETLQNARRPHAARSQVRPGLRIEPDPHVRTNRRALSVHTAATHTAGRTAGFEPGSKPVHPPPRPYTHPEGHAMEIATFVGKLGITIGIGQLVYFIISHEIRRLYQRLAKRCALRGSLR